MTDRPTGPATARFDCSECGQNVDGRELHTYLHCVLHKVGMDPADYELVLVKEEAILEARQLLACAQPGLGMAPAEWHRRVHALLAGEASHEPGEEG